MDSSSRRRSSGVLLFAAFLVTSALPVPMDVALRESLCVLAVVILVASAVVADARVVVAGVFCAVAVVSTRFNPWQFWPTALLVPLVGWGLIAVVVPALRRAVVISVGKRPDRVTAWFMALTVVVSGIALVVWHELARPDLGDLLAMIPVMPALLLPLACLGFAIVNAIIEELIWRGIIWEMLAGSIGSTALIIVLQAVSFGLFHIHGFPRGVIGVVMASVYGVALGWIRHRTGGLGAVIVTHVFADIVIFVVLISLTPSAS
ncbi:MAG: type II CAAX endopeptidase family protein [Phycisphaerae bacterium]|jgi:membrane protease YdiL (CAAX protease family)